MVLGDVADGGSERLPGTSRNTALLAMLAVQVLTIRRPPMTRVQLLGNRPAGRSRRSQTMRSKGLEGLKRSMWPHDSWRLVAVRPFHASAIPGTQLRRRPSRPGPMCDQGGQLGAMRSLLTCVMGSRQVPAVRVSRAGPKRRTAALHEQRLVDRLVRHPHHRIVGDVEPQPPGDLLRRPPLLEPVLDLSPNKATHTAVALDANELELSEIQVRADAAQLKRLLEGERRRTGSSPRSKRHPCRPPATRWPSITSRTCAASSPRSPSHRRIAEAVAASGTSVTDIVGVGPIVAAMVVGHAAGHLVSVVVGRAPADARGPAQCGGSPPDNAINRTLCHSTRFRDDRSW